MYVEVKQTMITELPHHKIPKLNLQILNHTELIWYGIVFLDTENRSYRTEV